MSKKLPFGQKQKGRVPNPAEGALTLLINPGEPPPKGSKAERGNTMAGKTKAKTANPKKKDKTSNPKKKKRKSGKKKKTNPKKKKRKRSNPEDKIMKWNQGLEGVPQAIPAILAGVGGWASSGLIAALIGPQARKSLADSLKGSANAQLLLSTVTFGGWWAASSYFKDLKPYRKAILMGSGIRWFFDLANAFLPKQAGSMSSNVRAFLGLPGGDMTMALPGLPGAAASTTGTTGTTGTTAGDKSKGVVKVKKEVENGVTYLMIPDGSYDYTKQDVLVKDGIYYDKENGKLLVHEDGTTPWKSSEVTLSGYQGNSQMHGMGGWQNFEPYMAQTMYGWQYFQPVMNGGQLAGHNVHSVDGAGQLGGWQYFQPAMSNQGSVTMQGPGQLGTPPSQAYTNFYNLPVNGAPMYGAMGNSPARAMMPVPGFQFAGSSAQNSGSGMDHTDFSL